MVKKMLLRYKEDLKLAKASLKYTINQQKVEKENYFALKKITDKFIKDKKAEIVKLKKLIAKNK